MTSEATPQAAASPVVCDFESLLTALRAAPPTHPTPVSAHAVLLRFAPLALLEGAWLWPHARVRRAEGELGAAVVDALDASLGGGDDSRAAPRLYRALLGGAGVAPLPADPRDCAGDPRWQAADLALAEAALALSRADDSAHEAVGYHTAWAACGLPPAVLAVRSALGPSAYWEERAGGHRDALARARRLVEACTAERGPAWPRVWAGARRYLDSIAHWQTSLAAGAPLAPRAAMLQLVAAKAHHAHGHHGAVQLDGRSLDTFLQPGAIDAGGLLEALARSPHVSPRAPEQSSLLRRSTAFGGPMFGVFDERELAVVRAWVEALPSEAREARPPAATPPIPARPNDRTPPSAPLPPAPRSAPALYRRLLRAGSHDAEADRLAKGALEQTLESASPSKHRLSRAGLLPYSEQALRRWVDQGLWDQVHPRGPALELERGLTKADATWLLLQLAPAALVDGAWLERVLELTPWAGSVACPLFRIYRDELGAGVPAQHHGNVLRRALAQEGVVLPPCDAAELAGAAGMTAEAFCLPTLWLSIARHTRSHLPELLGLNLAIEMAGIGDAYGRAIRALRRLEMDPLFFELHQSIDNGSTGHTRWSVDAIVAYMSNLEAAGDSRLVETAWLRLWRGHRAYSVASGPLGRRALLELGPRLSLRWLARTTRAASRSGRA